MPFNANNPSNSEKIRRLGIVIRPNWIALEQGSDSDSDNTDPLLSQKFKVWSTNFFDRSDIPSAPNADADRVYNSIVAYSKTDADTSLAELFVRHEDQSITQMTKGPANIAPSGFANAGETFLPGGLLLKYAFTDVVPNPDPTYTWTGAGPLGLGLSDFPNSVFNIQITRFEDSNAANNVNVRSFTLSNMVLRVPALTATTRLFIVAIGN